MVLTDDAPPPENAPLKEMLTLTEEAHDMASASGVALALSVTLPSEVIVEASL